MSFFIQGTEENVGQPAFKPFKYTSPFGISKSTPNIEFIKENEYSRFEVKGLKIGSGYQGYLDKNDLKQGKGVMVYLKVYPNTIKTIYEGHFIDDSLYGKGTLTVIENKKLSLKYTGNFERNKRCGRGKLTDYKKNLELDGTFDDDAFVEGTRNVYRGQNKEGDLYDLMNQSLGRFLNGKLEDPEGIFLKYESGKMIDKFEGEFEEGGILKGLRTKYTDGETVELTDRKVGNSWVRKIYYADGKTLKSEYKVPQFWEDLPYGKGIENKYDEKEELISTYKGKFLKGLYTGQNAIFEVPGENYIYIGGFKNGVFSNGLKYIYDGEEIVTHYEYKDGLVISEHKR